MSDTPAEVCTIPLSGIQLVEASAGTGKTHVIVGLYLRALAVLDLPVDALLLLSYTVAATTELRLRVQRRLLEAAALAGDGDTDADAELAAILAEARAAHGEDDAALAARLARAARTLDRARIQTIHAWARHVAADEALALGLGPAVQFVDDETEAGREALADAWRAALEDPARSEALLALGDPDAVWPALAPRLLAPGEALPAEDPAAAADALLAQARLRLLQRRAARGCHGIDEVLERLARLLPTPAGAALARRLGARHPVVLIDEFQDADARQYAIFRALHAAGGRALLLVGDPKQAIYRFRGGDLDTYLTARADATRHRLLRNWRARPALITGLNSLYGAAGARAFAVGSPGRIRHEPLRPAGRIEDRALAVADPALLPAALCFAHLPGAPRILGDRASGEALLARHAAQLLVDWQAAAASGALLAQGEPPRIAVLAENHAQLDRMAAALTERGLAWQRRRAPRGRGRAPEADGLAVWLAALLAPTPERIRALADGPLAAVDDTDGASLQREAALLRREGVVAALRRRLRAALEPLPAEVHTRLLRFAERLALHVDPDDPQALLDGLVHGRLGLPPEPEHAEAGSAIALLTVHAAKGLEFDLVLLPFSGARARGQRGLALEAAEATAQREERLRSLYVALTRARFGVVVGLDLLGSRNELPALYHLLGADETGGSPAQAARRAVEALADGRTIGRMVWPAPEPAGPRREASEIAPPAPSQAPPPPPAPGVASYSSLLKPVDSGPETETETETETGTGAEPGGADFGSAVHAVLEHADFAAWTGRAPLPATEAARLEAILARLPSLDEPAARRAAVEHQVRAALNAPLPEGLRLCELSRRDRRAELPFTLRLRDPRRGAAELARLALALRPAGLDGAPIAAPAAPVGWLTGIIDLVYRHAGRWFLIDWKSNRLRPAHREGPLGLARAVAESGYELQMLLYAVALDRWLARRLPDYRRERDLGGVRWLYLRALSAEAPTGIHAPDLPGALLDAAGALFAAD